MSARRHGVKTEFWRQTMSIWVSFSAPINTYCEAVSASMGMSISPTAGGIRRQAQASDFSFTKGKDELSPNLALAWSTRTVFESVWVELYKENPDIPYLTYKMAGVQIMSYRPLERATESVQFKISTLEIAHW
jgi:type VI protein secretion system component Hcp